MTKYKKYFAEGLLIVFSVLFALFFDKMYDDYLTRQKCEIALDSVVKELKSNQVILSDWQTRHGRIKERIDSILEGNNPQIKTQLEGARYLELGVLTDQQSLADSMLTATSWESARSSGVIAEFDFETTRMLTDVYNLQEIVTGRTFTQIIDFYFEGAAHSMDKLDTTLIQFKLRFDELTSQEWMLMQLYQEALQYLDVVNECGVFAVEST